MSTCIMQLAEGRKEVMSEKETEKQEERERTRRRASDAAGAGGAGASCEMQVLLVDDTCSKRPSGMENEINLH